MRKLLQIMKNENNQNILHISVVEPRGTGGMIHYAYQLCSALSNNGAQVTLITSSTYEMDDYPHNFAVRKQMRLWSTIESQQIETNFGWIGSAAQKVFRATRRAIRAIRLIIEWIRVVIHLIETKPDIVQFGKIEFPFEAFFLAILKRKGLVLSQICHEFELREQGNGLLVDISNRLYSWVYDTFSVVFFHGESNRQRFLTLFNMQQEKLHLIEHGNEGLFLTQKSDGITAPQFRERYKIAPDAMVILFFGNLMPSKGIPDLLMAFAQVYKKQKRARLVVAGNPSRYIDMSEIKKLVVDLEISEATVFDTRYIPMEDVAGLMDMAIVAVYPYLNSTQSGALQVAYTFGKAVIATNVGGLPEAIEAGRSGIIVPPASPNSLAEAILYFIDNPQHAKEMGEYAKYLSVTRFSWDAIAKKIYGEYIIIAN